MADRLPRKLAAILYADVAGYSRLTGEDEEGTHRLLSENFDLISGTVEEHRGRIVHYAGDAVLVDFGTATDALACAVATQRKLRARNHDLPDERKLLFRMGVNLGEVIVDRDDIYGDGVNVAARLESLAEPGGVCISDSVRTAVGRKLDFDVRDMGEQRVKNIDQPVHAYRVAIDEMDDAPSISGVSPASIPADKPSIAVLPFANMSEDTEQAFFCDGITEDIITALSHIPDILVMARSFSFVYKDKTARVADIARNLGVRYVLEGSVRKAGGRVRITAQLIDAENERHLWAERYDRGLDDIFAIQDDITHEVAIAMQVKLATGDVARQWSAGTKSREAWESFIAGREQYYSFTAEGNLEARRLFEQALKIDPDYGSAIVWLGWTHWFDARYGYSRDARHSLELAELQVARLESFENRGSLVGTLQAAVLLMKGKHDEAVQAAKSALEYAHGPGDRAQLGMILMYACQFAEAIAEITAAIRQNPQPQSWFFSPLALALLWHGDLERAVEAGSEYLRRSPSDPFAYATLAVILNSADRREDARRTVTDLLSRFPTFTVKEYARSQHYKDPRILEHVLAALREAGVPE